MTPVLIIVSHTTKEALSTARKYIPPRPPIYSHGAKVYEPLLQKAQEKLNARFVFLRGATSLFGNRPFLIST